MHDKTLIMYREENNEQYTKTTFPLPQNYKEIIKEKFWMSKYNKHIFHLVKRFFHEKDNCIIHIHTLNLIDLALLIKQHINCKIITHLHCIPWKDCYNTNPKRFNHLYHSVYHRPKNIKDYHSFLTNNCEYDSYSKANHIISGTQCGVDFLTETMGISRRNITIANNGMNDYAENYRKVNFKDSLSHIQCLFVANLSKSKGLDYVLKALRIVKEKGFNVTLKVAGYTTPSLTNKIKRDNPDLNIDILGVKTFEELIELYKNNEIGLIASLQEQFSFVGIEMAMFGLPVVTTAVDGLDEIFTDNINALKVNACFSIETGLSVDVAMMAEKIILLIENKNLRINLSKNARKLFENRLKLQIMMKQTISVYHKMIGELQYE